MTDQPQTPNVPATIDPMRAALDLRGRQRAVMRELRNKTWGKDLGDNTLKALVLWCEKRGMDAATEVDVLGGNIYLNAKFYLRKLAQKIDAGLIDYAYADHVEHDERLLRLANDASGPPDVRERAKAENYRRAMERIAHRLPDTALAAVVFRVKVKGMTTEMTGAKAVGGFRGKNAGGKLKDPIGEEFPTETAESRAARRACRQIIDAFPDLKAEMDVVEAEAKLVAVEVQAGRAALKAEVRQPSLMSGRPVQDYGYGDLEDDTPRVLQGDNTPMGAERQPGDAIQVGPDVERGDAAEEDDLEVDRRLADEEAAG
jgi:hypothetical protein